MSNKQCQHCDIHSKECQEEQFNKTDIVLYLISIILFVLSFIPVFNDFKIWIYAIVVLLSGYKLIISGIMNIFTLNFEEDTLMTIAMISAFCIGEYPESCMVVLLYRLGEFLEDKAVDNSNKNIKEIVKIKAKTANVIIEEDNKTWSEKVVDVEDVEIGQRILIKPGEMIPLDCRIVKGTSTLDTSSLTGESTPVDVKEDEKILSGSINLTGALECVVEKDYKNSTASQIVDLVYEASNNKGKTEEFITKFSKIYTPVVIILAIIIAIIPPIVLHLEFKTWMMRALVFLVASCPCSIVISVPLAFFSTIGTISKKGMIIKGTKHIEDLAEAKYVAMDKTGTITTGKMQVDTLVSRGNYTDDEITKFMYALERNSNHPISTAIKEKVETDNINVEYKTERFEEIPGLGIKAVIDGKEVLFGNRKLLDENYIFENMSLDNQDSASYIIIDGNLEGYVTFKEEIREHVTNTITRLQLKSSSIDEVVMLTGDNLGSANEIAKRVGIEKVFAELLPQDKLEKVRELKEKGKVIFIGDGINDSPVLAEANFGISMGESSEIASNTADAILLSNNMTVLPRAIKIARKAMGIIKFNIVFSLLVKAVVLILGLLGYAPMWLAVVADTGVSLLTVLNSVRIFNNK